ncbi:hypothetical protein SE17_10615 [Kouleothrix aurantiaca]|uniref:Uncharacterized protein n=1 Tax=Kouleothrix aurantiaca TaxID=186479 RepID=A0A0N8PSP1_9CHLR|nr:hypothetical protein SE17_10615 [Kouleothrix aurantiaca]
MSNHQQAPFCRCANNNETILILRMIRIGERDYKRIRKDRRRFGKSNAMFVEVILSFLIVPFKIHAVSIA